MVIYFSGTGNTRFAAEIISGVLGSEVRDIKELIRQGKRVKFYSVEPYIICAPIYAWRFPPLVESFIENSDFWGSDEMYFVATCESQTGDAARYLKKICEDKGMKFMGFAGVRMPENYTLMYKAPDKETENRIIHVATYELVKIAETIYNNEVLTDRLDMKLMKRFTSVMNPWFYGACVSSKKFRVTDKCVGCGRCARECPYMSIKLVEGKPVWGEKCTHCMSCINGCPAGAIEYGRRTVGRKRYYCNRDAKIRVEGLEKR